MKYGKTYAVSALCLCIGLVLFVVGFAMMGFDIRNFDTDPVYTEREYTMDGNVSSINIEDVNAKINITLSSDKKIHLKYYENLNETYRITKLADGSVSVCKERVGDLFDKVFNISVSTPILTVQIPKNYAGKLFVENSGGNITATDITIGSLSIETENGTARAAGITVLGSLDVETDGGALDIYDISVGGTCKLTSEGERLFAQSLTSNDLYLETSGTPMTLVDVNAKNSVFAETEDSNIKLGNLQFGQSATLIADGGNVSGSIIGSHDDFTYNCNAQGGSCNLEQSATYGTKQLNIRTAGDDINILLVTESTAP